MNKAENNSVIIIGKIASEFTYNHEVLGEKFYGFYVDVERTSGVIDELPLIISERLVDVSADFTGKYISVVGQLRSYNLRKGDKHKLVISVFVSELELVGKLPEKGYTNEVYLCGFVCKPTSYRKTPLGREIADILLAINRAYGKSDYIPCICWGRNAKYASNFEVSTYMAMVGRLQSRKYIKKLENAEEEHITYEVSVSRIEVLNGEE